jgi:diguanylate cyclase (GGDEF)-like protein
MVAIVICFNDYATVMDRLAPSVVPVCWLTEDSPLAPPQETQPRVDNASNLVVTTMPLPLEREQVQRITEEIELVIATHLAWFRRLNKALVYGDALSLDETAPTAYRHTAFGRWYYTAEPHPLAEYLEFQALAPIQQSMHQAASRVLTDCRQGTRAPRDEYDRCIELSLKLNTQLRHLQLEVIGELLATDTLTGAFTRRGMILKLQGEQERAQRSQRPSCLCLLDFDRFKRVNDELGHAAGDAVLRQGIRFAMNVLRKYDSIFRYGGEEFLICLPSTPLQDAHQVIERIRVGLEKLPIILPSGDEHHVTASFGLAEMLTRRPVEDTIKAADKALYQAKANGRNQLVVSSDR